MTTNSEAIGVKTLFSIFLNRKKTLVVATLAFGVVGAIAAVNLPHSYNSELLIFLPSIGREPLDSQVERLVNTRPFDRDECAGVKLELLKSNNFTKRLKIRGEQRERTILCLNRVVEEIKILERHENKIREEIGEQLANIYDFYFSDSRKLDLKKLGDEDVISRYGAHLHFSLDDFLRLREVYNSEPLSFGPIIVREDFPLGHRLALPVAFGFLGFLSSVGYAFSKSSVSGSHSGG